MIDFEIPTMTCGHCTRAVTEALKTADPQAKVVIDLPTHHVQVTSSVPREALVAQLVEAGYTPA